MTVYYISFLLAVGTAAAAGRHRRAGRTAGRLHPRAIAAIITGAVLVTVAGLRWRVGTDYMTYESLYPVYRDGAWSSLNLTGEPGLRVISRMGSWIYDDPALMFAIASVVTVGLTVRTIYKSSQRFALAILIYILSGGWQLSFNVVRQQLAVAILFSGHHYIIERRFFRWAAVVMLATLFHLSAVTGLFFYFVPTKRLGAGHTALLVVAAVVAVLSYEHLATILEWIRQEDIAAGTYFQEEINPLRLIAALAPVAIYLLLTDKDRVTPTQYFYINMITLGAAATFVALESAYVARFVAYFSIYLALAVPAILRFRTREMQPSVLLPLVASYAALWYVETAFTVELSQFRWVFQR